MKSERFTDRWVAYFDLLGFKKLLEKHQNFPELVLAVYQDVLSELDTLENQQHVEADRIDYCWFSDTFLLWSINNDFDSFIILEQASRLFFSKLLMFKKIPMRGSISFGPFYSDKNNSIYMGQALVDAYEYAEKQKWVNYVLTPSVLKSLPQIILDSLNRKYCPISTFSKAVFPEKNIDKDKILGYNYAADGSLFKIFHKALNQLSEQCRNSPFEITQKYDNSLAWLETQQKRFEKS